MKFLEARHLRLSQVKAVDIPALFNQNNIPYNSIDVINWHAFPYCPKVEFAIAHTGDTILLHYRVEEDGVRAVAGKIWDTYGRILVVSFLQAQMQMEVTIFGIQLHRNDSLM